MNSKFLKILKFIHFYRFNIRSNYARCPRCDYELKNIYLFKFLMKDSSIFENNSFFEAYVFTYDLYPSPTVILMFLFLN